MITTSLIYELYSSSISVYLILIHNTPPILSYIPTIKHSSKSEQEGHEVTYVFRVSLTIILVVSVHLDACHMLDNTDCIFLTDSNCRVLWCLPLSKECINIPTAKTIPKLPSSGKGPMTSKMFPTPLSFLFQIIQDVPPSCSHRPRFPRPKRT